MSTVAELGGLSCQLVDMLPAGQSPRLLAVLCHGFGAPGTDLVPIGSELILLKPRLADSVRFIFPAAPLRLDEQGLVGGRAWWMLDTAHIAAAIRQGQLRSQRMESPDELPRARQLLMCLLQDGQAQLGTPASRIVLGGFSQGAILAVDVALRLPEPPAALCVWSGTLLCEQDWRPLAQGRANLPVLQSHGRQDPLLPFEGGIWLRDMFTEAGMQVDFVEFEGGHAIPGQALRRLAVLLEQLALGG
jgi:phospholipase/carboxylesterase